MRFTSKWDNKCAGIDIKSEKQKKLQYLLLMKAFNARKNKPMTLLQQFIFLRKIDAESKLEYLILDDLFEYLSISPFHRGFMIQIFSPVLQDLISCKTLCISYSSFLHFLQTAAVNAVPANERSYIRKTLEELPHLPQKLYTENTIAVYGTSNHSQDTQLHAPPPPTPGLWKKREITIEEKITEYTKIDDNGLLQRLIEKEKQQTEVLHMESVNGEFAHREITNFETTEHLNDELVHHDHVKEEFVHFKSKVDEFSRFESSNLANTQRNGNNYQECEQQPPSPTLKRDSSKRCSVFGETE